jgi:hypothetical protein
LFGGVEAVCDVPVLQSFNEERNDLHFFRGKPCPGSCPNQILFRGGCTRRNKLILSIHLTHALKKRGTRGAAVDYARHTDRAVRLDRFLVLRNNYDSTHNGKGLDNQLLHIQTQ